MSLAWNLVQFILILMLLVLIHEWGHMQVAKWCGMRVERFSIFFGKPVASFQRGETEYAIGWLPLGGYVKISGMTRDEEVPAEHAHRTYHAAPVWRRIATIAAGPGVNVLFAILAFAAMFWIGQPRMEALNEVAGIMKDSPAQSIGLRPGDSIVAVNGTPAAKAEDVRDLLSKRPGQVTAITYRRGDRTITRSAPLEAATDPATGEKVGRLGFTFHTVKTGTERYGPVEGLTRGAKATWWVTSETTKVLARQFREPDINQASSVVGMGAAYNEVADRGLWMVLQFAGLISLALAIFNLLPIPPLDGGHILFAIIKKIKGSPVPRRVHETASMVGMAAILLLAVVLIQNDIFRIANGTLMP